MNLWSIVLAAGRGQRLSSVTGGVPKQFWSPDGDASLLESTITRLLPCVPTERVVTVVDRSHRPYVQSIEARARIGTVVYQPGDSGTAAGVLLGLRTVLERDPHALVLVAPSDHGIGHTDPFLSGIRYATTAVRQRRTDMVLFGAQPSSPATDYGWITPAARHPSRMGYVAAFVEKPASAEAQRLFRSGAVWNTMVMAARAATLHDLYRTHLPATAGAFDRAFALDARTRAAFLADAYPGLARADFSRDLLGPARDLALYVWPQIVGWTDLGTPERLEASLNRRPSHRPDAGVGVSAA